MQYALKLSKSRKNSYSSDCLIEFKDKIFKLVKKRKITSIECSLQSGNIKILELMNRYKNLDEVLKTMNELRKINPNFHLHSQFIVGFPTETEEQFEDSLNIGLKLNADVLEFFAYSDLESAPSYKMHGKITQEVIEKRLEKVRLFFASEGYYYNWNLNGIFIANRNYVTTLQLFNKN